MRTTTLGISIVGVVWLAIGLHAQQTRGGDRQIVQRSDIAGTGLEAVAAVHHWAPRTATGWHTHPGEMVGLVTQGSVVIERRGHAAFTVTSGESFVIAAGLPHQTVNATDGEARMFVTYIVPKNHALSRGAPQ